MKYVSKFIKNIVNKYKSLNFNSKVAVISTCIGAFSLLATLITLKYVITGYQSPAEVKCELEFVQRPDSIYQMQLYVWNVGDENAKNIIFEANKLNVFQVDTSKRKTKVNLLVYPYLSVSSELTPSEVLSLTGKVVRFNNYRILISNLEKGTKYDNYFIIMPDLFDKTRLKRLKKSIYVDKFKKIKSFRKTNSYVDDIYENIKLSVNGRILNFKINKIISKEKARSLDCFFPTRKDFYEYPKKAIAPYYELPPLQVLVRFKQRKRSGGWQRWQGWKGWSTW